VYCLECYENYGNLHKVNTKRTDQDRNQRGFSLVEMLVVIMVIGILAAIAIPLITNVLARSNEATIQRNAQSVAALASQAMHAGNTSLNDAATKEEALTLLVDGVTGADSFENVLFRLPLSPNEQTRVLPFLVHDGNGLLVVKTD
ncbi:MAG: type IV pilin protein, partial [Verrucomicrobiales bacterium]